MKVGLIGVGLMGHGIARNVLGRGGFALAFMDHPGNQPVDEILSLGGKAHPTAAAVAKLIVASASLNGGAAEATLRFEDGFASYKSFRLLPLTPLCDCR